MSRESDLLPLVGDANLGPRDRRHSVDELGPEQDVGVVEHPVLQRHDDELEKKMKVIFNRWARFLSFDKMLMALLKTQNKFLHLCSGCSPLK